MDADRRSDVDVRRGGPRSGSGRKPRGGRKIGTTVNLSHVAVARIENWRGTVHFSFNRMLNSMLTRYREMSEQIEIDVRKEGDFQAISQKKWISLSFENQHWLSQQTEIKNNLGQILTYLIENAPFHFGLPVDQKQINRRRPHGGARSGGGRPAAADGPSYIALSDKAISRVTQRKQKRERFNQTLNRLLEALPEDGREYSIQESTENMPHMHSRTIKKRRHVLLSPKARRQVQTRSRTNERFTTALNRILEMLPTASSL